MNMQTKKLIPLWKINIVLFIVLSTWHILAGPEPTGINKEYFISEISAYLNIPKDFVFWFSILSVTIGVPYSIKIVWNRFFAELPNMHEIGFWHGFTWLLILEFLNVYFR
jgi:hypothetical protein